jgi:hypothetical protein
MEGSFAACGHVVVSRNRSYSLYLKDDTARTEGIDGSAL